MALIENTNALMGLLETVQNLPEASSGVEEATPQPNIQCYHGMASTSNTAYTATAVKLIVAKTGTYKVSWMGARNRNTGSYGSRLYINGAAYGAENTGFTYSYGQTATLTNVQLTEGQEIVVHAKSGSTSYVMMVGNLIIEQTD